MAAQDTTANTASGGGARRFLREVKTELKRVTWPKRQQLIAYTIVVLVTVIIISFIIWALDTAFAFSFRAFLKS